MTPDNVAAIFDDAVTQSLIERTPLMRLAYTGTDGGPRVIPLGYLVHGSQIVTWTIPTSVKVRSLRADPRVAVTIDVGGMPPCCLLARGTVELTDLPGVPEEYLEASRRTMTEEQYVDFEPQVRQLYDSMTQLTITPTWARLLDFDRTAPQEVERLFAAKSANG